MAASGNRAARGFLTSAAIALLALVVAVAAIRVRRQDLTGVQPAAEPEPATLRRVQPAAEPEPAMVRGVQPAAEPEPAAAPGDRVALAAAAIPCRHC